MHLFVWLNLSCAAFAAAAWAYINLHPKFRRNLAFRIDPVPGGDDPCGDEDLPPVVVLVPGRDEAGHLPDTLVTLCEQDYPDYRIIFIDDESTDATPAIVTELAQRYPHLTVVRNDDAPPSGWVGKCWAIWRGYQTARMSRDREEADRNIGIPAPARSRLVQTDSWLCFTDADIHWQPDCLRSAMRHAQQHKGDIVALFPRLRFGSAIEAIVQSQLALALGLMYPMDRAMDPDEPDTLTGGAFILTRRALYDEVGGHEAVRGEVVEDLALGKALKGAGGRVRVGMAPDLLWCRMYDGWPDMWEGLTKNAYAGLFYQPWRALGMTLATLLVIVLTPIYLIGAMVWTISSGGGAVSWWMLGLSLVAIILQTRVMSGVRRLLDLPWPYALVMPVGTAVYLAIVWASVWRYYFGGNIWKGRRYGSAGETGKRDLRYYIDRLIRYGAGGALSGIVTVGVTALCVEVLGIDPQVAFAVAIVAAFLTNFTILRYFVFTAKAGSLLRQFMGYLFATLGFRVAEYLAFLALYHGTDWYYLLAVGAALTMSFILKFLLFDRLVFKRV